MALIITPQEEIDNYFMSPRLSQSKLKRLTKGLRYYLAQETKEDDLYDSDSLILGSAIDCLLTGEEGAFESQYHIAKEVENPSDSIKNIIHLVLKNLTESNIEIDMELEDYSDLILMCAEEVNYGKTYNPQTKINKVVKHSAYFDELVKGIGKTIITYEQFSIIKRVCTSLTTNTRTKQYFDRDFLQNSQQYRVYYQKVIYFEYEDIQCKALLDMLIEKLDSQGNVIEATGVDLKTTMVYTLNFNTIFKSFRYDIQAAWYNLAMEENYRNQDVTINPFKFIVESTKYVGTPIVLKTSASVLQIGLKGLEKPYINYKGIEQLVGEYLYYENQGWLEEKIIAESNGELTLTWDKIV